MSALDDAMRDFVARQGATQCAPVLSAKQSAELARARRIAERERAQQEHAAQCAQSNAENARYDQEGVWYVGGFKS